MLDCKLIASMFINVGVCRLQQKKLVAAIRKAWDHGTLLKVVGRLFVVISSRSCACISYNVV